MSSLSRLTQVLAPQPAWYISLQHSKHFPLEKVNQLHQFGPQKGVLPSYLPKIAVLWDVVVCLSPRPIDINKMERNPAAKENKIILLFFRKKVSPWFMMEVLSISQLSKNWECIIAINIHNCTHVLAGCCNTELIRTTLRLRVGVGGHHILHSPCRPPT